MSNTFITASAVSRIATAILENNLIMPKLVHTGYTEEYKTVGDTLTIPTRWTPSAITAYGGSSVSYDTITESTQTIVLDQDFYKGVTLTAKEKKLTLEDLTEQVIRPVMRRFAQDIDSNLLTYYANYTPYWVGTPGTTPNNASTLTEAGYILDYNQAPVDGDRTLIMSPRMKANMLNVSLFVSAEQRGKSNALDTAQLGNVYGFDTYMDQNIPTFTPGTVTASGKGATVAGGNYILSASAAAGQTSLVFDSFAVGSGTLNPGGTVLVGDKVYISATNNVASANNMYTVTANATVSPASTITCAISPALTASAAVSTQGFILGHSASGTANTPYQTNLAFHKAAYSLVWAKLPPPMGGADGASYSDPRMGGMPVTVTIDWDQATQADTMVFRVLFGRKVPNGKLGVVVLG